MSDRQAMTRPTPPAPGPAIPGARARLEGLDALVEAVRAARQAVVPTRAALVALTGIDASGKGFVAGRLAGRLEAAGLRPALIGIDPWLELPARRFGAGHPGGHFYEHAIRFPALFGQLVEPLRARRSIRLEADLAEETATAFHRGRYAFDDVDVIVLEGIFLLRRALQGRYDLAVWIDCSPETALERALARRQEGLDAEATIRAYRTIYFPAQQVHLERDRPLEAAHAVLPNDPRRGGLVT